MPAKNNKLPTAMLIKILGRFMTQRDIESLYEEYQSHCYKLKSIYQPTDNDIKVYKECLKEEKTDKELCKILGVSPHTMLNRFAKIGRMVANKDLSI